MATVGTAVAAALGWLNRRRRRSQSYLPVRFSGRTRSALLERVWSQRIVDGLERSLRHAAEMRLGLCNTPELVKLSFAQSTAVPGEVMRIEAAYEQAGGQLLVVGAPGSGKTTEALKLMRHLLEIARNDPTAPVPEICPLSSWAKERKPILDWVADEVRKRHGRPLGEARRLIGRQEVVPVLDGLDEVAPEHRVACIEAINRFWETHRGAPLVVCSRQAEYEGLEEQLKLGGGVTVCPPEPEEVDHYLAAAGSHWEPVRACLRGGTDPGLRDLLSTPLMLCVAVLAYQGSDPMELCATERGGPGRDRLWSRYVTTATSRDYTPTGTASEEPRRYSEDQARRWLGWIAKEMASRNETELWLHEWSGPPPWQKGVKIALGLVLALASGLSARLASSLSSGLGVGLGSLLGVGLTLGSNPYAPARRGSFDRRLFAAGLAVGLTVALVVGLAVGLGGVSVGELGFGVIFSLVSAQRSALNIGRAPTSRPSFDRGAFAAGLAVGLAVALVVALEGGQATKWEVNGSVLLAFGLAAGLAFGLNVGPAPTYRKAFDRRGFAAGLVLAFAFGLAYGLTFAPTHGPVIGLATGLSAGLVAGLAFGLLGIGPERERVVAGSPGQPIGASARLGVGFGLAAGVVAGLAAGLGAGYAFGLLEGPAYGLGFGLALGLDALVFHYAFRLWLCVHHFGPWDWPAFLRWASDHLLLRTSGVPYQWIHLELRDHMAEQAPHSP